MYDSRVLTETEIPREAAAGKGRKARHDALQE